MSPHHKQASETSTAQTATDFKIIHYLMPYLWPKGEFGLRVRVVLAVFFLIFAKIITVYVPYLYKYIIDSLGETNTQQVLYLSMPIFLVIAYGVARAAASGFQQLRDTVFTLVGQRASRLIAVRTFEHIHNLSLRFHLVRRTGGLSRIIDRGIKGIDFMLRMFVFNLVPVIFEVALVVGLYYISTGAIYGHITLVIIVIYVLFTYYVNEWRNNFRRDMNDKDTDAAQKAVDSLINFETVKYFTNERLESDRFHDSMRGYEKAWVKIYTSLGILNFGQALIIAVGLTFMMVVAGQEVIAGTKTIGEFVFINTLLVQLYAQLNFLGTIFREIKQSLLDMENMFHLLDEKKEVVDADNATELQISHAVVDFKNVDFSYASDRSILHDVSFIIPAGKTTAVIGHSGAGKSTLTRLLFRFYDTTAGSVLIDNQNIKDVTQESLRKNIGIVPQDTVLFNDTIEYNIRYGRVSATEEEVFSAAKAAQIHDFILSLPEGYQTQVGERGLKLSGGEKQRIAIARTILKNPPILIFDEATSALDSATENAIQAKLNEISYNRTTLIIAHRLSTIVQADEIIVLDKGRIVEQGTHRDLIAKGAVYAMMWQKQQQEKNKGDIIK